MEEVHMCICGKEWSRQCQWDQITSPLYLDTSKLTNNVQMNIQIAKNPNNYCRVEHRKVNSCK